MIKLHCGCDHSFDVLAVIFDKDGTLADSHRFLHQLAHQRSRLIDNQFPGVFSDLMVAFGCPETGYDPRGLMAVGTRYDNEIAAAAFVAATGVPWVHAVAAVKQAFVQGDRAFSRKALSTPPIPGIPHLLRQLRNAGLKLAVLSGDTTANIQDFLACYDLANFVDWVAGSEVPPVKPDSSMLHKACAELLVFPSQVVVVGDSLLDYQLSVQGQAQGFISVTWGNSPAVPGASVVLSRPDSLQAVTNPDSQLS